MKKIIIWIIIAIAVVGGGVTAFLLLNKKPDTAPKTELVDVETQRKSAFSMDVLKKDDIVNEKIKQWLEDSISKGVDTDKYYAIKNNADGNLNVYIYMPKAKEKIGDIDASNVKVTKAGSAVKLMITTDSKTTHEKASEDLILHVYLSEGGKAGDIKSELLVINDKTYFCDTATFANLG